MVALGNVANGESVPLVEMCSVCESQDQLNKKDNRYQRRATFSLNFFISIDFVCFCFFHARFMMNQMFCKMAL